MEFRKEYTQRLLDCKDDVALFGETFLDHKVHDYNEGFLNCKEKCVLYRSGRKVGKSTSAAVKTLHFAWFAPFLLKTVRDRCDIVIVSVTQQQADIMMDLIKDQLGRSKAMQSYIMKNNAGELWIRFINGGGYSRIYTRAAGEQGTSLRGYIPHVVIVDEVGFVKEKVLVALLPAGIATDARYWLVGTPFGKSGYCLLYTSPSPRD